MDTLLTNKSTSDQVHCPLVLFLVVTRSLTRELFTPFEEPERVFHSTRKLFKTSSLYYLSSPEFDLFSDHEDQSKEEVTEEMGEPTIEEYMTITRINYESGNDKVDSLNITNVSNNQLRIRVSPFSLTRAASKKIEANGDNSEVKWDPDNIEFELWLALKFRNHKTMDEYTKNALWNYWRNGNDKEMITDNELSNPRDDNLIKENEVAQIFRIDTDLFDFDTPLCQAFKEFNYLSQIDVNVLTKDIHGFKTYEKYKDDWIYEWNKGLPWVD
ncbi:hypothetical protein Tco_0642795 [Tanacetum coccineum]